MLMKLLIIRMMKIIIILAIFTISFYYLITLFQQEYQQRHKYDQPKGSAVKVFQGETSFLDRMHIFFQVGE